MTATQESTRPQPVARADRVLTPDLVRGAMLLFIALANAGNVAFAGQPGIDFGSDSILGKCLNFLMSIFVNSRAYPVFAVMFGYGIVQLARRHRAKGIPPRRILLRRNAWLIVFGFVHATLLYFGDFLGAYGIVGILATVLLLNRSDRFHRLALWIWAAQTVYLLVVAAVTMFGTQPGTATPTNTPDPSLAATGYLESMVDRLSEWPIHTVTVIGFIVVVWLGMWAARRQVLEDPDRHRTLLIGVTVVGLGITVLGALPYALASVGVVHLDQGSLDAVALLHAISGEYGGPGYIALFALVAAAVMRRSRSGTLPHSVRSIASLGRCSLSGYLFQSVVWMVLLSPVLLHLPQYGNRAFIAFGVALGTWVSSVAAAWWLDTRGVRGPAERVLRRLTYGPRPTTERGQR